jgi:hypothetical protein
LHHLLRRVLAPRARRFPASVSLARCGLPGLSVTFAALQIGFILYSSLSSVAEALFTAGLVFLSRALTLFAAGPDSAPRTFTRWPLWFLFCLGLLLQVQEIPDVLATPVIVLGQLGAAFCQKRGRAAETRLDAALSRGCSLLLPVRPSSPWPDTAGPPSWPPVLFYVCCPCGCPWRGAHRGPMAQPARRVRDIPPAPGHPIRLDSPWYF